MACLLPTSQNGRGEWAGGGSLSYLMEGKGWLMCRSIRKGVKGLLVGQPMCCPARLRRSSRREWPPLQQRAHASS